MTVYDSYGELVDVSGFRNVYIEIVIGRLRHKDATAVDFTGVYKKIIRSFFMAGGFHCIISEEDVPVVDVANRISHLEHRNKARLIYHYFNTSIVFASLNIQVK